MFTRILACMLAFAIMPGLVSVATGRGNKGFVVVIDAGHGGKDNGASSNRTHKEKNVNLKVALNLGRRLQMMKGIDVYYTRQSDVFIPLDDRAQIANKLNADLFISIHTNSAENHTARGVEVYSFSPSANIVAARENSAMELEENYSKKYDGFDPNSSESYIQWDLVAGDFGFSGQSMKFAGYISKQLTKQTGLPNRGVKQAGFWVLKYSKMPGVLVEVGYISNPEDLNFLSQDKNIDKLSLAIANAFEQYKQEHDNKAVAAQKETQKETKKSATGVHYRVQFYTGQRKDVNSRSFKRCVPATEFNIGGDRYTYMYGDATDLIKAREILDQVREDFPDAFLAVFKDGERLSRDDAAPYFKTSQRK